MSRRTGWLVQQGDPLPVGLVHPAPLFRGGRHEAWHSGNRPSPEGPSQHQEQKKIRHHRWESKTSPGESQLVPWRLVHPAQRIPPPLRFVRCQNEQTTLMEGRERWR